MKDPITGKVCKWNEEKNKIIKKQRGFCFEMLEGLKPFYVMRKHNPEKYPRQDAYIYNINNYPVFVPFIEEEDYIFLKNMIYKREYLEIYNLLHKRGK